MLFNVSIDNSASFKELHKYRAVFLGLLILIISGFDVITIFILSSNGLSNVSNVTLPIIITFFNSGFGVVVVIILKFLKSLLIYQGILLSFEKPFLLSVATIIL